MTAGNPDVSRQAAVDAALVLLERMVSRSKIRFGR
jgi:hypothetical protein